MLYTTHQFIEAFDADNGNSEKTLNSIFLKSPHTAPSKEFTINIANSILYSLEKNTDDIISVTDMVKTILSAQYINTGSSFFGLFPYSLLLKEEDYIAPDYDFQPLVLLPLLKCYIKFQHLFPSEIMEQLSDAITLTTNIISYNSNLIDSHNKLLEIILLTCTGEYFDIPQFIYTATNKANIYYYFIKYNGDMPPEYNSPDIIISQLEAIDSFSIYINNADIQKILNDIKDILLSIFYRHFNPHIFQWTGPFSICPSKFMTNAMLERLFKITEQTDTDKFIVPSRFRQISALYESKFEQLLVSRGLAFPHYKQNLIASIYNTRTFSLCSFNHDDLWYRRMPCIGYFGKRETPYCLYIQCLLNGICFSSGAFHSIQHKDILLGHINFSTNRGYKGISSDSSDIYKTSDLRIRFCVEGDTSQLKIVHNNNKIRIIYKKLSILFNALYAIFDDNEITYDYTLLDNALYFDVILYSGKEIGLELSKINNAIVAFSLYLGERNNTNFLPETYQDKHFLYTKIRVDDLEIKLKSNKKPDKYEVIFSQDEQYVSDTDIGSYIENAEAFTKHHDFFFENKINTHSLYLKENNIHNKKILRKISNLYKHSLGDTPSEIKNIFYSLNSFSTNEIKHYSILILHQLYALANQTDIRFIRLIELNYADVYQQLKMMTDKKKIKKIVINTANRLNADYKKLQIKGQPNTTNILEDIIKTIHYEFTNPDLSLQNIAARYNISESYISRKFSQYMGTSYLRYLTQLRINKAVELLNSNGDISDIHIKCGYYNMQTFETAFKKIMGFTYKSYLKRSDSNN